MCNVDSSYWLTPLESEITIHVKHVGVAVCWIYVFFPSVCACVCVSVSLCVCVYILKFLFLYVFAQSGIQPLA